MKHFNDPEDNIWIRKQRRTAFADAEDLTDFPTGGWIKQWLLGLALPSFIIFYGICCIRHGHTLVLGEHGNSTIVTGNVGFSFAISYILIGLFMHFHYFWGLSRNLWRFSYALKSLTVIGFVLSFLYAMYRMFAD